MTTERVYDIKVNGADSMNELKSAVSELTEKLKSLDQTSKEYLETLKQLTDYQQKLADAMGGISDSAEKTDNSLNGIKETVDSVADSISSLGEDVINSFAEGFAQGMAEAATETAQMSESMDNGVNSVKGLKQEISDLRDKLVTLDSGTEEYKETVQQLINDQVKLKEVMNAGKNETQAAEGSYNALTQRMSALKQVWKETTDEATRNEIGQQINEINNQLKAMDASIGNNQRNVGNYKSALDGLDASFVTWKQELKECKEAMQQLDPSTQEYADAMARAAEITHQMSDQQEMIKYSSTDLGDQLSNIRGIASNMAAGFSAVNAAMGLFGEENEELQQAMLKVQQAMALVQGLQGLEGFTKRTKGLSVATGAATKQTAKLAATTMADANASRLDAQAKTLQTTATEGAIPAQLGLNAAMKANPIGFIIGAIATIVTLFVLFKDKIMELIGANEDMSKAFDKVKAVLAGVGNVIKKSVINPIKLAIIPIKTLAKVMIDLFKGDWSKIGDDIKAGMEETKDVVIDTINVVGAFKEGYDKKTAEQNEAARKKEAEARTKELDSVIKDNEARYGSDWKYTEEGKKLYEEYYIAKMEMYDKDTEEFKEAQREQLEYERDVLKQKQQNEVNEANLAIRLNEAKYGSDWKYTQAGQKAYQEMFDKRKEMYEEDSAEYKEVEIDKENFAADLRKHSEQEYKNHLSAFRSTFDKYIPEWTKIGFDLSNLEKQWSEGVKSFRTYLIKTAKKSASEADEIIAQTWNKMQLSLWNDMFGKQWNAELEKKFYQWDRTSKNFLKKITEEYNFDKITRKDVDAITGLGVTLEEEKRQILRTYENIKERIEMEQNELQGVMDKMFTSTINDLRVFMSMEVPQDTAITKWFEEAQTNMAKYQEALQKGDKEAAEHYLNIANMLRESLIVTSQEDSETGKYLREKLDGQLGVLLEEYQKMLDKMNELSSEFTQNELDKFVKLSDNKMKSYNAYINKVKNAYDQVYSLAEKEFAQEQALYDKRGAWLGDNEIESLKRQEEYENQFYINRMANYEALRDKYIEMSQDMELTTEERANAEREAYEYTTKIIEEELEHTTEILKIQKDQIKAWIGAFKDAFSGLATIFGSLNDYYTANMALEQQRIDQLLENNKISQEEAEKRYQQQEENFNKAKNMEAAMTVINGLSAAIGAYQSLASIPYVGPFLGAAAAAAALAASIVNAQKIRETTMENPYKNTGGGGGSTNFQLPSVMELEQNYGRNITGMNDTDSLNNIGGNGRGETAIRTYVVESDITASQELANKRSQEVTF